MNIFKRASQLRRQHPHKHRDYQGYVQDAKREQRGKGAAQKTGNKKKVHKKGPSKKRHKIAGTDTVGAVSFAQLRSQYKKSLEEKLAWRLLARDQAKTKTERKKKSKDVAQTRRELNSLK